MPVRLPFQALRASTQVELLEVEIEVNDPEDVDEISAKLNAQDFTRKVITDDDIQTQEWSFRPTPFFRYAHLKPKLVQEPEEVGDSPE